MLFMAAVILFIGIEIATFIFDAAVILFKFMWKIIIPLIIILWILGV